MTWLAIGIGNTLRSDDGLGPWLAERIADWRLPGVTIRVVHQLTPELAVEIAQHDRVLFLDSSRTDDEPRLVEVEPAQTANRLGHAMSPGDILAWASAFGARRPAWAARVPGSDYRFGEGLSAAAAEAGERALADIARLLREHTGCTKSV